GLGDRFVAHAVEQHREDHAQDDRDRGHYHEPEYVVDDGRVDVIVLHHGCVVAQAGELQRRVEADADLRVQAEDDRPDRRVDDEEGDQDERRPYKQQRADKSRRPDARVAGHDRGRAGGGGGGAAGRRRNGGQSLSQYQT